MDVLLGGLVRSVAELQLNRALWHIALSDDVSNQVDRGFRLSPSDVKKQEVSRSSVQRTANLPVTCG